MNVKQNIIEQSINRVRTPNLSQILRLVSSHSEFTLGVDGPRIEGFVIGNSDVRSRSQARVLEALLKCGVKVTAGLVRKLIASGVFRRIWVNYLPAGPALQLRDGNHRIDFDVAEIESVVQGALRARYAEAQRGIEGEDAGDAIIFKDPEGRLIANFNGEGYCPVDFLVSELVEPGAKYPALRTWRQVGTRFDEETGQDTPHYVAFVTPLWFDEAILPEDEARKGFGKPMRPDFLAQVRTRAEVNQPVLEVLAAEETLGHLKVEGRITLGAFGA